MHERSVFPEGEFLRSYAFSQSCPARLGADSLPLVVPRTVLDVQISVLSHNPAQLAGFLHVLTSCLQRLGLAAAGG